MSYFAASDFRSLASEVTAGCTGIVAIITAIVVTSIRTYFKAPNFGVLTTVVAAII
jgi:hypothetical protein